MSTTESDAGSSPVDLASYGRDELAVLVREYLLAGHLIDRAGMPQLIGDYGMEPMRDIAIDEWMGASPIYTRRMQQLLGYEGDDVETMFKGIQFDIGSPPQFMDFRFKVDSPDRGEFWLDSCGALMDVEPMGDEFVVTMCHHIEDPTFDATACAVNPRARVRPIHRPPRVPADRHPHCHWSVTIDPAADPIGVPDMAVRIGRTLAAALPVVGLTETDSSDGRRDYQGPLEPDLPLESFAHETLVAIADEVCLQGHLLTMAFLAAIESRYGHDAALAIGHKQFIGIAGVVATRLKRAFGLGPDLASIATALDLHPAFRPRSYVDFRVDLADRLTVSLGQCPARSEPDEYPWPRQMNAGPSAALDAIVQAVEPRARVLPIDAPAGRELAWEVVIGDEPAMEAPEVLLTRFSTGADFVFQSRP